MKILCKHAFHKDIVFGGDIGTATDTRMWTNVTINYESQTPPVQDADGNFYDIEYPEDIDFNEQPWANREWNTDFDEKVENRFFRFLDNISTTELGFDKDVLEQIEKKFGLKVVSEKYYISKRKDFSEIEIS